VAFGSNILQTLLVYLFIGNSNDSFFAVSLVIPYILRMVFIEL
jgi:hypothetical protein